MTPVQPKSGQYAKVCKGNSSQSALCERILRVAEQGPEAVSRRLDELNREWTIGRWVKVVCGLMLVVGMVVTVLAQQEMWPLVVGVGLFVVAGATLMQYAFFKRSWLGWAFAAFGARSGSVIEDERIALRVLRGDFRFLPTMTMIHDKNALTRMSDEGGPAMDEDDDKYDAREAAAMIAAGLPVVR